MSSNSFLWLDSPRGPWPPHCRGCETTRTHHARKDSSGRAIGQSQTYLPDNIQHLQERETPMPPDGVRTHSPTNQAAPDPRLKPCGRRDRRGIIWHHRCRMSSQPGRQVFVTMLTVRSDLNACLHSGCLQIRTEHITASNQDTVVDSGEQL